MKLTIKNFSLLSYISILTFNRFGVKKNNDQKKANVIIIITDDQGYGDLVVTVIQHLKHLILIRFFQRVLDLLIFM